VIQRDQILFLVKFTFKVFLPALLAELVGGQNTGKRVNVKEVVFDSAVADIKWFGPTNRIVLVQTTSGRLYRSTTSGDKWDDITDQLNTEGQKFTADDTGPITVDSMQVSPVDKMVAMVAGKKRRHFISINGGETWRRIRHSTTIHTWLFHKTRPKWALLSTWSDSCDKASRNKDDNAPCQHSLYITRDLGRTFSLVTTYVVQFSWGDASQHQQDRIYFTHFRSQKGDQEKLYSWSDSVDLSYTDDWGSRTTRMLQHGNKFVVSNGFIFVAKLKSKASQTVNLMCSADGGRNFRAAQLSQDLEEKAYTILDTSEGTVMIHVNHGSNEFSGNQVGNVYVSDKDGSRYALSLKNNVRSSSGEIEFDKVLSLEGVYLANVRDVPKSPEQENTEDTASTNPKKEDDEEDAEELEKGATSTAVDKRRSQRAKGKAESVVRTVISFYKGGVWSYLKPPKIDSLGKKLDCPADRCWLHMHGITNSVTTRPSTLWRMRLD